MLEPLKKWLSKKQNNNVSGTGLTLQQKRNPVPRPASEHVTVVPVERKQKVRLEIPSEKMPLNKASFFIKLALVLIALFLLIASLKLLMDYTSLVEEKESKEQKYAEIQEHIDELQYYIDSPMDAYYVRKFAWEIFRMVPSNGKTILINPEN